MKKLFFAALALVLSLNANAQFGIVGGVTSTTGNIKEFSRNVKNMTQYHVGLAYKIPIGSFAIQPAIEYNVKGAKLGDVTGLGDLNFKTGYVEVPVQVQFGFDLEVVRPYVFAEPFVGYAVNNKITWEGITETGWDNVKQRFEYGVGLGLGVDIVKHLQLSVRYFWNMGSIYGADITFKSVTQTIYDTKCSGIAATLGFFF